MKTVRRLVSEHPWILVNYACFGMLITWAVAACLKPVSPAQQAQDAQAVEACVQKDWGQPLGVIAGDCYQGILTLAEDGVADIEAILESATQDAGTAAQAALFPYNTPAIRAKVDIKLAAKLAAKRPH